MGASDLLFDVIGVELRRRGLKSQSEISDFVRERVGWKIPQQAVSKIVNRQLKDPRQSTHVLMLLMALDRDATGKPRPTTAPAFDEEMLKKCVIDVERFLQGREIESIEQKADIVARAYRIYLADGEMPSRAVILEFARPAK